ncbi:UDP-N-acetylglucosamine 2-epimerase (non-hydrolyzing) [Flavobacteriaceae bacterium]|nr:UDP-N-acetylglucosamine 2-epimerase (non-hydrolyzing) [Flavobacteriaceae bacterium]
MNKILLIVGTRPELIKVAPLYLELKKQNINARILDTGQHKDILQAYWEVFGIKADYEVDILSKGQDLANLNAKALVQINQLLIDLKEKNEWFPELIIAQGDTTTVLSASLVAFYNKIKFGHLEAGLRSFNLEHPFPEEFNRRITSIATNYHFAPTHISKENLLKEAVNESNIIVTGNTIVDAVRFIQSKAEFSKVNFENEALNQLDLEKQEHVLITCHRRENHENISNIIDAVNQLATENKNTIFIWPVHPNPNVKGAVESSALKDKENLILTAPLSYMELLKIIENSSVLLTDSGGIQEEGPSFGKKVIVMREATERPEAILTGNSELVGNDTSKIVEAFYKYRNTYIKGENPFGDGNASEKVVHFIKNN